jgi:hypothetical protein
MDAELDAACDSSTVKVVAGEGMMVVYFLIALAHN